MKAGIDDPFRCPAFAKPPMKMQCEAITLVSTYSEAHRCFNKRGIKKVGKRHLCANHKNMEERKQL